MYPGYVSQTAKHENEDLGAPKDSVSVKQSLGPLAGLEASLFVFDQHGQTSPSVLLLRRSFFFPAGQILRKASRHSRKRSNCRLKGKCIIFCCRRSYARRGQKTDSTSAQRRDRYHTIAVAFPHAMTTLPDRGLLSPTKSLKDMD